MSYENLKALVVDDDQTSRKVAKSLLGKIGFKNCVTAENGQMAWEFIIAEDFDLILCDLFMPVMSGVELLKKLRAHQDKNSIPFIMVTAADQTDKIIEIIKAGVNSYIIKPYSVETIEKQVGKVLQQNK